MVTQPQAYTDAVGIVRDPDIRVAQGLDQWQTDALYRLTDRLQHEQSLAAVYEAALDAMVSALSCERASILLFDDAGVMRFVAWRGLSERYREAVDGHSPWTQDAKNPEPVCVGDIDSADLSDDIKAATRAEGIRAAAFIPLIADGRLIGKFMTYFGAQHTFDNSEIDLSLTIARQLAFAIDRRRANDALIASEHRFREMINALPAAIYTTDAQGRLTHFNPAAVDFSGRIPELGSDRWCVGWKLYRPDGTPLPHSEYPMGVSREDDRDRGVRATEAIMERPDGSRRWFVPYPTPLFDGDGRVIGGINMLVDITEQKRAEQDLHYSEARLAGQKAGLELAVSGAPLDDVLNTIVSTARDLCGPKARTALFLVDRDRGQLLFRASSGMPHDYANAADGFEITPSWVTASTGNAVVVRDVASDPRWLPYREVAQRYGIRACWSFPIRSFGGKVLGTLEVYHDTAREPAERDRESLAPVAQTAALVIEQYHTVEDRVRAVAAMRESQERLASELADTKLLQEISAQLIDDENVDAVYETIMDATMRIMHSQFASMQMLHSDRGPGEALRLLAFRGFSPQAAKFWEWVRPESASTCAEALRTGRRVIVDDVEQCGFTAGSADLATFRQTGIRAVQTTPLMSRSGKMLGMISSHWSEPHRPAERDLRLLDILARQAADLIERRSATEELRRLKDRLAVEVEDLNRLHALSARLIEHDNVADVLTELLAATTELLHTEKGTVQLCEGHARVLNLVSAVGFDGEFAQRYAVIDATGATPCAAAARLGTHVIVEDVATDPGFAELGNVAGRYGIRSAQSLPLIDESGTVVAVLTTYFDRPHLPSERELRLLDLCTEVAVRQIERKRADEALAFLAELSAAFAPLASVEEIAGIASEKIRAYFRASGVHFSDVASGSDEATLFYSDRADGQPQPPIVHKLSQHLAGASLRDLAAGRPVVIGDVSTDEKTTLLAAYGDPGVGSMVLAPYVSDDGLKFLLAAHKGRAHAWRASEAELLHEVAARLYLRLERARAEQALAASEAKLREADQRKDQFLAMLAHELRNPLAPIVNALQLLDDRVGEAVRLEARAIIDRQTTLLARLVDDLLEVSRITSGRIQLQIEQVAFGTVVARAVETVRPLIAKHRHSLRLTLPAGPVWLNGDATRLEQVIVNLLNNAAKYTQDGGIITVSMETDATHALLKVVDNGIGIEPTLIPRIFELFTQAERSLDRAGGGLGIGLSLVQKLVAMHGGSVGVTSVVGQGSEFSIRLPLATITATSTRERQADDLHAKSRPLRILVVDDNVDAAQSLGMLLEASAHHVRCAYDGLAALKAATDHNPHVVFLDIGLPTIDGYEVARRLRAEPLLRNVTLVAMTGYGQASDRKRAIEAGFNHHLVKPSHSSTLDRILAEVAKSTAPSPAESPN